MTPSETPGETPVERRLREMCELGVPNGYEGELTDRDKADIDAGREAIRILRESLDENTSWHFRLERDAAALLARCEETR